jgi:type IV pilus assembly protein PilQ
MASRKLLFSWLVFPLLVWGSAIAGEAGSVKSNLISGFEVHTGEHSTQILLRSQATPAFTVFKLKNPDRLVVDLLHCALSAGVTSPKVVDNAHVNRIATASFKQAGSQVSRVIIGLKPGVRFNAVGQGNAVVVTLSTEHQAKAPTQRSFPQRQAKKATALLGKKPAKKNVDKKDHAIVASHGDKKNAKPVTIRRIVSSKDRVAVSTDVRVSSYEVLEVFEPFRLVVDIYGASIKPKRYEKQLSGNVFFDRLRAAKHADKVRLVLDLHQGKRQDYIVETVDNGLWIRFGSKALQAKAVEKKTKAKAKVLSPAAPSKSSVSVANVKSFKAKSLVAEKTSPSRLKDLVFKQDKQQARVVLDIVGSARPQVTHSDSRSTILEIPNCSMPINLERTLDTSEFGGVIQSLSAYRVQDKNAIKVVAVTAKQVSNRLERRTGRLHWVFESKRSDRQGLAKSQNQPKELTESVEYAYAPDQVAGYSVKKAHLAEDSGGGKKRRRFRGRRISLDFKDADIHNILRLISEVARLNIITSDDVKGKITITMRNVPWDQALDIILKTKKLGKVRHGNIIRIAPMAELAAEQELAAKAAAAKRTYEPLRVRMIAVNYATASDLQAQVKNILSERGSITVDTRTNVLVVRDVLENLIKAEGLVRSLDTQTPQVLIEARIVEANTQYIREVGIQWGGNMNLSAASGNPTGLSFPSNVIVGGAADDGQTITTGTANPGQFAVNMPAAVGAGSGGALGFIFGSAGGAVQLNLRLSALENRGAVKIISAPKITTLDNNQAKISQGVSIPISVTSAAGVNTVFVEARLELEVTPHITQEGSILLQIKVRKNEPDFSRTGAKGDPTILKKEAETIVLVKDSETTVIGGIYTRKTSDTYKGIPVLSQIPILGWFFRRTKYNDDRTELLIFITPRIVNRLESTVSQR